MASWPNSILFGALALMVSALLPLPAQATSQVLLSLEEHAEESQAVVRATVGNSEVVLHPEWKRPLTRTTLVVHEVLRGDVPSTVVVEQLGGQWGDETLYVPGDARLTKDQEVVVFLAERLGGWHFTAMEQSSYRVVPSLDGPMLERDLTSNFFLRGPSGALKQLEGVREPELSLEELKRTLHDLDKGVAP